MYVSRFYCSPGSIADQLTGFLEPSHRQREQQLIRPSISKPVPTLLSWRFTWVYSGGRNSERFGVGACGLSPGQTSRGGGKDDRGGLVLRPKQSLQPCHPIGQGPRYGLRGRCECEIPAPCGLTDESHNTRLSLGCCSANRARMSSQNCFWYNRTKGTNIDQPPGHRLKLESSKP